MGGGEEIPAQPVPLTLASGKTSLAALARRVSSAGVVSTGSSIIVMIFFLITLFKKMQLRHLCQQCSDLPSRPVLSLSLTLDEGRPACRDKPLFPLIFKK